MKTAIIIAAMLWGSANAGPVETLPAGQWYEVPNSHLRTLDPCPAHNCSYSATEGVSAVIDDWSGGAYDYKRDRLIVWGGGHGGYGGNEIYVFDLAQLKWIRVNDPSDPPGKDLPTYSAYAPDGGPTSRHTYNALQYVPVLDRFCAFSGSGFYPSGQTGTRHTDCFDFDTQSWTPMSDVPSGSESYAFSAIDHVTGYAWVHGSGGSAKLSMFNPLANTWTVRSSGSSYYHSGHTTTSVVDPKRRILFAMGESKAWQWNIDATGNAINGAIITTTGDNGIQGGPNGLDYDPVSEGFVAWGGGQTVYAYDPGTKVWTSSSGTGASVGSDNMNNTYGRFRYIPSKNVFIVVNSVDKNVFIYRRTAAASAPQWYRDLVDKGPGTGVESAYGGQGQREEGKGNIQIFPNPARQGQALRLDAPGADKMAVYDLRGRLVREERWGCLSSGVYLAKAYFSGSVVNKKIVVE